MTFDLNRKNIWKDFLLEGSTPKSKWQMGSLSVYVHSKNYSFIVGEALMYHMICNVYRCVSKRRSTNMGNAPHWQYCQITVDSIQGSPSIKNEKPLLVVMSWTHEFWIIIVVLDQDMNICCRYLVWTWFLFAPLVGHPVFVTIVLIIHQA